MVVYYSGTNNYNRNGCHLRDISEPINYIFRGVLSSKRLYRYKIRTTPVEFRGRAFHENGGPSGDLTKTIISLFINKYHI